MRILPLLLVVILTSGLIIVLDTKILLPAPLGRLLAPQSGIWQNAEKLNENYNADLSFPALKGNATVFLDDRLIPHIFAEQENDAYFIQGYLHAKFRLWQMELQVMSAAGRASEIVGKIAVNHDREFRRLGMVFAAENSLQEMEKSEVIKSSCDAYTAGVNSYIISLTESQLPIEYKLLGYKPELWSNLKTALFLKYMSYDLASAEDDFEMTNAKSFFNASDMALLFPANQDSADPIIPKGTVYPPAGVKVTAPSTFDSSQSSKAVAVEENNKADRANGSNNWAVSGSKTKSGAPILCNDPHLGLNLPSLWYEIQISTPNFNAYGASFPGAPSVIIGFNDSCAFGFTNGGRDVRDYYEIEFKDDTRQEYWFNNRWIKTSFRYEQIKIAGEATISDTVAYTIFGPVMYDKSFSGKRTGGVKNYAVKWTAHAPSNELLVFNMLDHARNYNDYLAAALHLETPGQNCVFADKAGDIAIRAQGNFPAKWEHQGDYIMPGRDSSYMWQGMIPQSEIPYQYNPERGFVSSANQRPTDSAYPYYLGNVYPASRGKIINRKLDSMTMITPQDMMKMQNDNYNIFAEMAMPIFLKHISEDSLSRNEEKYFSLLKSWNLRNDYHSKGATIFVNLFDDFKSLVFDDEYAKAPHPIQTPAESTLLEAVLRDSSFKFLDNINTARKENLEDITLAAFRKTAAHLRSVESEGRLEWGKNKDTHISHLLKIPEFSRLHLPIGGGRNVINATRGDHGPSWRMIVSLTAQTEAYGVYPGGQSGNPGSRFYDNFIDFWVEGKYYPLWMMTKDESGDKRVKWKMRFSKS